MKRLLITGSRDWTNATQMSEVLRDVWTLVFNRNPETILVHGAARGADRLAKAIWEKRGLPTEPHPAKWKLYGKRAGRLRNEEMVSLGADFCVAFLRPESIGTKHCLKIAREAGIHSLEIWENEGYTFPARTRATDI